MKVDTMFMQTPLYNLSPFLILYVLLCIVTQSLLSTALIVVVL